MIQKNDEAPLEISTVIQSRLDEISHSNEITKEESKMTKRSREDPDVPAKAKVKKLKRNTKKTDLVGATASSDSDDNNSEKNKNTNRLTTRSSSDCNGIDSNSVDISENDILKLRTAYKQCKLVLKEMESKYGHLLESDSSEGTEERCVKRKRLDNALENSECNCTANKKIVFNEDGQEVTVNTMLSNHICPTKLSLKNIVVENKSVDIVYYNKNTDLTDNLPELRRILQDPSVETAQRNRIIEKIKSIKQGYLNEIKFNKLSLIEKLKTTPDDVFTFKGSNLSLLNGYCVF